MIENVQIENKLKNMKDIKHVKVTGDGYHYQIEIVSDCFVGQSRLAREQFVYAQLKDEITSGNLHAVSMQTWTVAEWEKQHG